MKQKDLNGLKVIILGVLIALVLFTVTIMMILKEAKPHLVEVYVGDQVVTGRYHFEDNIFTESIGKGRDIQTGGGIVVFEYKNQHYRVEIPTDARIIQIRLQEPSLQSDSEMIEYKTDRFGSDVRLSRVKTLPRM
ncbi:MAG TPA: hypothetical protein PLD95_01630 [bacterium]|nr:hypothetical protein [bacterium]HOG38149.1 hypothetical protein [bacterium]HQI03369.1 hypothetical protein [bacterium]